MIKRTINLLALFIVLAHAADGQTLSSQEKNHIMKELSTVIQENYVLQDSVSHILKELSKSKKSNDFKRDYAPAQFAPYLTELLRSITLDAHFAVMNDSNLFQAALRIQQEDGNAVGDVTQSISIGGKSLSDVRRNFHFTKMEVLNGNVGYLKIEQIPSLESAKETVDAAMTFVKHTDALIIDLRSNPGGVGRFIPYLISYFLPEQKQLLYSREYLAWDSTAYHYTHEKLGGDRYLDKPVYVLINRFTGSAATNMSYTMKSFDAALLVGMNTGSGYLGAHSATVFPLSNNMVAIIPIGRVVNARTNSNWRAKGVDPDIACSSEEAFNVAYSTALQYLLSQSPDADVSDELKRAMDALENSKASRSSEVAQEDLSEYAGQYGETTISFENGKLYTKRPSVPIKLEIKRKEGDLFKIQLPPNARGNVPDLRFNRENEVIVSLTTIRDGVEERTEKRE